MIILENNIGEIGGTETLIYINDNIRCMVYTIFNSSIDPYLKIYTGKSPFYYDDEETKMCRISILHPKYIGSIDENLILDKDQIDYLYSILKSKQNPIYGENISVWDSIINEINCLNSNSKQWKFIPSNLPIPYYYELLK